MKKLLMRLYDIKDPETMTFKELEALLKRKYPAYHLQKYPGPRKSKPSLPAGEWAK